MTAHYDLIFHSGTVVNHDGIHSADIGIRNGKIVAIGTIDHSQADEAVDATGLHILPGVIDSQVHFREPGLEHKEDLARAARSWAASPAYSRCRTLNR